MPALLPPDRQLQEQHHDLHDRHPSLSDDEIFVLWYLQAQLMDDEQRALDSLTGTSNDRTVDAIVIEPGAKLVSIVQAKYRQGWGRRSEKRSDVQEFASVSRGLFGDSEAFRHLTEGIDPFVRDRLKDARARIRTDGYRLELHYVTTGTCSEAVRRAAEREAKTGFSRRSRLEVITSRRLSHVIATM